MSTYRRRATDKGSPVSPSTAEFVSRHVDELASLPQPPETFTAQAVDEGFRAQFKRYARTNMVEICGTESTDGRPSKTRQVYRLTEYTAQQVAQRLEARDAICPCGHSGLRNRGSHYECGYDACDQEFARDELEVDD